jgi:hypothetical protein
MSRTDPGKGCLDFAFAGVYTLGEGAEVALEDYARALAGARTAETIPAEGSEGRVRGVHLCDAAAGAEALLGGELEDFARDLAARAGPARLGWE